MPSKRPTGRPSKLSDTVQEAIVESIKRGNYLEVAVRAAGINPTTYYRWMEQGEADLENDKDTAHARFREAVLVATAQAEAEVVGILRDAMPQDWRAAVEWLKRRFPDRWRDRKGFDVDANVNAKAEVTEIVHNKPVLVIPTDDRREEVARILADAMNPN